MPISPLHSRLLAFVVSALSLGTVCGCGAGTLARPSLAPAARGVTIQGGVHGGNQPVTGSSVYLYAASNAGYGTPSVSLLCGAKTTVTCLTPSSSVLADGNGNGYVVSDANGGFNITGQYTCPAGAQVYLLALGGNPGLGAGSANPDLALMAALGSCATLAANGAATFININEVTTVASVYALAPFMASATAVGTSGTNALGLANAFSTVYNLVNFTTGASPGAGQPVVGALPAGLPAGLTVPSAEIDTLADVIAFCVNSSPSSSTACSTLFADATNNSVTPADTIAATLSIAKNPGQNVSALYSLSSAQSPFQPTLSVAPQDWTIGLLYAGVGSTPVNSNNGYSIAVDAAGNVYATNNAAAYLTRITPTGVFSAIGASIAVPAVALNNSWGVAVDLNGNLWVTNSTSGKEALTQLDPNGNLLQQATPTSGGGTANGGMAVGSAPAYVAIDGNNNIWFTNFTTTIQTSVSKFTSSATAISPSSGYFGALTAKSDKALGLAIDSSNNAWLTSQTGAHKGELFGFSGVDGSAIPNTPYLQPSVPVNNGYGLAIDGNGNAWIPSRNTPSLVGVTLSGGALLPNEPTIGYQGGGMAGSNLNTAAVDGNNNIWLTDDTANNVLEFNPGTSSFLSPVGTGTAPTGGFQLKATTGTRGVAIDASGNVWCNSNKAILQMVGAAAPVLTPMAQAIKSGKLGQLP